MVGPARRAHSSETNRLRLRRARGRGPASPETRAPSDTWPEGTLPRTSGKGTKRRQLRQALAWRSGAVLDESPAPPRANVLASTRPGGEASAVEIVRPS